MSALDPVVLELTTDASKLNAGVDAAKDKTQELIAAAERLGESLTKAMSAPSGAPAAAASLGQLATATKQVGQESNTAGGLLDGLVSKYVTARFAFDAVRDSLRALMGLLTSSVAKYAEAESAARRLTVALQTQGLALPNLGEQYAGLGRSYEDTTAYSHTAIEAAEALFVQLGNVGPAMMDRALKAATDLSSGLGMDLNSAVELLSKAAEGQTQTFSRYGIVLDQSRVKAEGFSYVLDAVESKVGGQAQAELDTYAGKVKQLGNRWDDAKEAIGRAIVQDPLVAESLQLLTDRLKAQQDGAERTGASWTHYLASIVPGLGELAILRDALERAAQAKQDFDGAFAGAERAIPKLPAPTLPPTTLPSVPGADDVVQRQIDAWKKEQDAAAAAAKAFRGAVDSMERSITGADLAARVKELTAAFVELGTHGKLTPEALQAAAKQADDLYRKGAVLSPQLAQLRQDFIGLSGGVRTGIDSLTDYGVAVGELQLPIESLIAGLNSKLVPFVENTEKIPKTLADIGTQVSTGFEEGAKGIADANQQAADAQKKIDEAAKRTEQDVMEMGRSFDQLGSVIGGNIGAIVSDVGRMVDAVDSAAKAPGSMSGLNFTSLASGIGAVASIASAALPAIESIWNHFFGTAGRDAVKQFADSMGGFDALHQELLDKLTNGVGEQFWVKLTQEVGRNDKAGAEAVIAQIQQALANSPSTLAADAGYQTVQELQTAANKAVQLWQYMRDSGQYTASEVADAWSKAEAAIAAAGDGALSSLQKAHDDAQQQLDQMNSQIQSLQASIAQEAPEAVEGVIEQQQRAQLASLQAQAQAQQQHVDDLNQQIQDAAGAAVSDAQSAIAKAGTETVGAIQDALDAADFRVRVKLETDGGAAPIPEAEGGAVHVTKPTLFEVGEAGAEDAVFSGAGRRLQDMLPGIQTLGTLPNISIAGRDDSSSIARAMEYALSRSQPTQITVVSLLDGKVVARNQVMHIPGVLTNLGVKGRNG